MLSKAEVILEVVDKIRAIKMPDGESDFNEGKASAIRNIISALEIWKEEVEKKEREENKKRIAEAEKKEETTTPSTTPPEKQEKEKDPEDTVDTLIAEYLKMYPTRQIDVDEGSDHFCLWMERRLSPNSAK